MPDVQKKTTSQKRVATQKTDSKIFDPAKQVLWSRPGYLVRRLNQIHYAMFYEECKTQNVTPVQYGVLTALSLSPWLDQTAIGMELGLDRTTTADVVKRLQERGLVERRTNPNDKRSRQAVITQEGLRIMGLLQEGMARAQQRLLEPLSTRNQEIFMKLLSTLVEANNQYSRTTLKPMQAGPARAGAGSPAQPCSALACDDSWAASAPPRVLRTHISSAAIATAISAGVLLAMRRPTGPCRRSIWLSSRSNSRSRSRRWLAREPSAPT